MDELPNGRMQKSEIARLIASSLGPVTLILVIAFVGSFFLPLPHRWLARLIAVATFWGLVSTVATLGRHVVEYDLDTSRLRYRRLGRRTFQELPLSDVSGVTRLNSGLPSAGPIEVQAADGRVLLLEESSRERSERLGMILSAALRNDQSRLCGAISAAASAARMGSLVIGRMLCSGVLLGSLVFAAIGLRALQPGLGMNPVPFLGLGAVLGGLGVGGLIATLVRRHAWISWFELSDDRLRFRVNEKRRLEAAPLTELRHVSRTRLPGAGPAWFYQISFADRRDLWVDAATLSNGIRLVARLRRALPEVPPPHPGSDAVLSSDSPLIEHLDPNERVFWTGSPLLPALRQQLAGPLVLSAMMAVGAIAALATLIVLGVRPFGLHAVAAAFLGLGIGGVVHSLRALARIRQSVYAVTDRGAIVYCGVEFPDLAPLGGSRLVTRFPLEQLAEFSIERGGRDIVFDVRVSRGGRRRTQEARLGFIACSDPTGAVRAIERALAQNGLWTSYWPGPVDGPPRS